MSDDAIDRDRLNLQATIARIDRDITESRRAREEAFKLIGRTQDAGSPDQQDRAGPLAGAGRCARAGPWGGTGSVHRAHRARALARGACVSETCESDDLFARRDAHCGRIEAMRQEVPDYLARRLPDVPLHQRGFGVIDEPRA